MSLHNHLWTQSMWKNLKIFSLHFIFQPNSKSEEHISQTNTQQSKQNKKKKRRKKHEFLGTLRTCTMDWIEWNQNFFCHTFRNSSIANLQNLLTHRETVFFQVSPFSLHTPRQTGGTGRESKMKVPKLTLCTKNGLRLQHQDFFLTVHDHNWDLGHICPNLPRYQQSQRNCNVMMTNI